MKNSVYTPIDPDFFDLFQQEIKKGSVKVIYFRRESVSASERIERKSNSNR